MNNWEQETDAHWKKFRPELYRELKKAGTLKAAIKNAVEKTQREMDDLQAKGFYEHEAWEMTREKYMFTPEDHPKDEPANDPVVLLHMEMNRISNMIQDLQNEPTYVRARDRD